MINLLQSVRRVDELSHDGSQMASRVSTLQTRPKLQDTTSWTTILHVWTNRTWHHDWAIFDSTSNSKNSLVGSYYGKTGQTDRQVENCAVTKRLICYICYTVNRSLWINTHCPSSILWTESNWKLPLRSAGRKIARSATNWPMSCHWNDLHLNYHERPASRKTIPSQDIWDYHLSTRWTRVYKSSPPPL